MPNLGDLVDVYPAPEHCPAKGDTSRVMATTSRFLACKGERLPWTAHLAARHASGEILLHPPTAPAPAPAPTTEK